MSDCSSSLSDQLILVTGATGCLGRNLTTRLLKEGYSVVATGRNADVGEKIRHLGATFIRRMTLWSSAEYSPALLNPRDSNR